MMKLIVTTPLILISLMGFNSCGSGPKEENLKPLPEFSEPQLPTLESINLNQTAIPVNSGIPIANRVAGRPGYVFNPFTQNMVEVNGLTPGTKVRDPQDPDPNHIFLVP